MRPNAALVLASLLFVACGNSAEPSAPQAPPPPPASASSAMASEPPPPASADSYDPSNPPAPKRQRPLEIHNSCENVATVVFGEDPNAKGVGTRTIAAHSSIDGPRDEHGNVTIHLLDEKSQPIVKVHVTRGMKRVEIGASCRTLDAR